MSQDAIRVVLVEDNDDDAELIARGVARSNREVELVRHQSVAEAIQSLSADRSAGRRIDLVILDGKVGGIEATEFFELAQGEGLGNLPYVMLTGSTNARISERMIALGARKVFEKPTEYDDFQSVIAKILKEFC